MNPRIHQDDLWLVPGEIVGWKAARLSFTPDDGYLSFLGVGLGTSYGPHDLAACVQHSDHVPPEPECECGFYAWRSRRAAYDLVYDLGATALLKVGLTGRFDEYERGWVAARQDVEEAMFVRPCMPCVVDDEVIGRSTHMAGWQNDIWPREDRRWILQPRCERHAADKPFAVSLEDMGLRLGISVGWLRIGPSIRANLEGLIRSKRPGRPTNLPPVRRISDLDPGEVGHVFQREIGRDDAGRWWFNSTARLIQPLPGTDVPIRVRSDGSFEVDLRQVALDEPLPVSVRHDTRVHLAHQDDAA